MLVQLNAPAVEFDLVQRLRTERWGGAQNRSGMLKVTHIWNASQQSGNYSKSSSGVRTKLAKHRSARAGETTLSAIAPRSGSVFDEDESG